MLQVCGVVRISLWSVMWYRGILKGSERGMPFEVFCEGKCQAAMCAFVSRCAAIPFWQYNMNLDVANRCIYRRGALQGCVPIGCGNRSSNTR